MNEAITSLPTLGIGASLSLSANPDPVKLVNAKNGPAFVEYAGLVDVDAVIDEVARVKATGAPVLFHPSYINFCGSYPNTKRWLEETARHIDKVDSAWFAQDCAYCFWESDSAYSSQLGYFIPPILNQASLDKCIQRIKEVQDIIPVPVAIEPPPVSFIAGTIPLFEFFGTLATETDCAILLDMGHLVSYEMATGNKVLDAINALPCERVIEVHIAGGKLKSTDTGPIYIDAHESKIVSQTWDMLDAMLPYLPAVKALCYECEGVDQKRVMQTLEHIRERVKQKSASEQLVAILN